MSGRKRAKRDDRDWGWGVCVCVGGGVVISALKNCLRSCGVWLNNIHK